LATEKKARKAFIDSIIEKATGTYPESIHYYYKETLDSPFSSKRDDTFSYVEFTDLSIKEMRSASSHGGGAKGPWYYTDKDGKNILKGDK
jgi:glucan-binding YG repeat protein